VIAPCCIDLYNFVRDAAGGLCGRTFVAEANHLKSQTLRVLLLNEKGGWVAQCLEHDIAAQGTSIKDAISSFVDVFGGQITLDLKANREPLSGKKEAPSWYWRAFREAEQLARPIRLPLSERASLTRVDSTAEAWVY
jgi:hypothetical protein